MVGQQRDELGLVLRLEQVREDACPSPGGSAGCYWNCYSAGRATRLENAPAGSLANASFVGAKTVYSRPSTLRNNRGCVFGDSTPVRGCHSQISRRLKKRLKKRLKGRQWKVKERQGKGRGRSMKGSGRPRKGRERAVEGQEKASGRSRKGSGMSRKGGGSSRKGGGRSR